MAEYKFAFSHENDLVDWLNTLHSGSGGATSTPLDDYSASLGRFTVEDKSENIFNEEPFGDEQFVTEVRYPNGVEESFGGSNKTDVDLEKSIVVSWTDTSGTDPVDRETTFYLFDTVGGSKGEPQGEPFVTWDADAVLPPPGTELTVVSVDENVQVFEGPAYADLVCFTRGTMILTERGEVAVEALRADDMVVTRDRGLQPIRWVGSRTVAAKGAAAPILIKAGALANDRDLLVSPNHRMLVEGWKAEALFGEQEVLATARQLTLRDDVHVVEGGEVEYFHILFDRHEIITANGAPSESLNPGEAAKGALADEARAEVLRLFPELENVGEVALVRPTVPDSEAALLN